MNLEKQVYTTFEVAKICNANITSIKNWIDQGELRAFRTPGGHYRIERNVLDDFLNRHGMPNPFGTNQNQKVLIVHPSDGISAPLQEEYGNQHEFSHTNDALDALLLIGQQQPDTLVLDDSIAGMETMPLIKRLRANAHLKPMEIIIVHDKDDDFEEALYDAGADLVIRKNRGEEAIIKALQRIL